MKSTTTATVFPSSIDELHGCGRPLIEQKNAKIFRELLIHTRYLRLDEERKDVFETSLEWYKGLIRNPSWSEGLAIFVDVHRSDPDMLGAVFNAGFINEHPIAAIVLPLLIQNPEQVAYPLAKWSGSPYRFNQFDRKVSLLLDWLKEAPWDPTNPDFSSNTNDPQKMDPVETEYHWFRLPTQLINAGKDHLLPQVCSLFNPLKSISHPELMHRIKRLPSLSPNNPVKEWDRLIPFITQDHISQFPVLYQDLMAFLNHPAVIKHAPTQHASTQKQAILAQLNGVQVCIRPPSKM